MAVPHWKIRVPPNVGGTPASQTRRMDPRSDSLHAQRSHLPIADQPYAGGIAYDAKDPDATFPPIEPLRPPAGAPNVLVVLLDDVGFGASSAFGGPCSTPTAERLARRRPEVQPLPHHRALLADPRRRC